MGILSFLFAGTYAKSLSKNVSLNNKIDNLRKNIREHKAQQAKKLAEANEEWRNTDDSKQFQSCMQQYGKRTGWMIYLSRNQLMKELDVNWETASESIKDKRIAEIFISSRENLTKTMSQLDASGWE